MSYHILFEGIFFVLSYSTHMWKAYVGWNLLEIKKTEKMKHAYNKDKARHNYFEKIDVSAWKLKAVS